MPIICRTEIELKCNRCKASKAQTIGWPIQDGHVFKDKYDVIHHCEKLGWKVISAIEQGDPEIVFCPNCKSFLD